METTKKIEYIVLPDIDRKIEESIHDSISFFNKTCPYCGQDLFSGHIRSKIHIDHFIPIKKGGQNVPWNVLPVCQTCNSKKKDKTPISFLGSNKYQECNNYLKRIEAKYVSSLQSDIEKFVQIKLYLSSINFSNFSSKNIHSHLEKVYELVFEKKIDISSLTYNRSQQSNTIKSYDDELNFIRTLFLDEFETPTNDKQIYKLSITEITKILQHKCNFIIRRGIVSKVLKENGFFYKLERINSFQVKNVIRLSLKHPELVEKNTK